MIIAVYCANIAKINTVRRNKSVGNTPNGGWEKEIQVQSDNVAFFNNLQCNSDM